MASIRGKAPLPKKDSNQNGPGSARRTPAWSSRASPSPGPTYNASSNTGYRPSNGFPPLSGQPGGKSSNVWGSAEDIQQLLAGLAGSINQIITVSLRSKTRYEGVLTFVSPSATDDASITLKNAKDLSAPNAAPIESITIKASNVFSFTPGPTGSGTMAKVNDSFRTDGEISRSTTLKRERELQAWQPDPMDPTAQPSSNSFDLSRGDDVTFGPGASGSTGQWDQFAVNERLFGVLTHFDEEEYTTRLDRNAKDYRERERRAEQIAAEITGSVTNNTHIAEERGIMIDDSGVNEEDKYGAVIRGVNAYVPPGARRQGQMQSNAPVPAAPTPAAGESSASAAPSAAKEVSKERQDKPDKSDTAPPRNAVTPASAQENAEKQASRASPIPAAGGAAKPLLADPVPAFRDFVTNEKQRLTQKRLALVKSDMDKRVAELVKFSQDFKLNKPIPEDLVPILAKDQEKQRQIREKSNLDAQSTKARSIGVTSTVASAATHKSPVGLALQRPVDQVRKPSGLSSVADTVRPAAERLPSSKSSNTIPASGSRSTPSPPASKSNGSSGKLEPSKTVPRISMVIQSIPPFRGQKKQASVDGKTTPSATPSQPLSPTAAQRLNANATSFRPNPKAAAFTPNGSSSSQSVTNSKSKSDSVASPTSNPFFGTQPKKSPPVNVKDDFNPLKHGKVLDAITISGNWPYSGKRYMQMFPSPPSAIPPQASSPHMPPHNHSVTAAPPSYDEDAAVQAQAQAQAAATRGYAVYAFSPYYPGQPQPIMAGMPGVPPGFVPGPYMQHVPYPPNIPPPNAIYGPPHMGQMPPPQQYMPPPGAYPPPPSSGGPRPSMPPTPIPAHAHAYYHQSPQLQHAMPYPMMMAPPGPNGPIHPYDAGAPPPVPMGGVGHA